MRHLLFVGLIKHRLPGSNYKQYTSKKKTRG
jgi:hypothetical protein